MQQPSNNQWLTPQFATMIISNVVAILLAKGIITPDTANVINNNTAVIGAIFIFLVMNAMYLAGTIAHSLRSSTPLPTGAMPDALSPSAPSGPASPSYGPPSTGTEPAMILPADLAGVV